MVCPKSAAKDAFSPSARIGFGCIGTLRKTQLILLSLLLQLFPEFFHFIFSFKVTNPKNRPVDTFIESARPLARVGFNRTDIFL